MCMYVETVYVEKIQYKNWRGISACVHAIFCCHEKEDIECEMFATYVVDVYAITSCALTTW